MKKYLLISILLLILGAHFFVLIPNLVKSPTITTQFPNRIQEVLPSVVHIQCDRWQGSGVAITEDIVVTARHVVDGLNYTITLNDGMEIRGIQAITHKDYDIGFIKVDTPILKPAEFGSVKDCVLGESIFIVGSPFGFDNFNSVTLGIISGLGRNWNSIDYRTGNSYGWNVVFTSDSAAHPGNSGGPVFSMDGVVRGLLVGGYSPVLNCNVPCDLFLGDIEVIRLMFTFNKYKQEQEKQECYRAPY